MAPSLPLRSSDSPELDDGEGKQTLSEASELLSFLHSGVVDTSYYRDQKSLWNIGALYCQILSQTGDYTYGIGRIG
jgi:hypothetical protein